MNNKSLLIHFSMPSHSISSLLSLYHERVFGQWISVNGRGIFEAVLCKPLRVHYVGSLPTAIFRLHTPVFPYFVGDQSTDLMPPHHHYKQPIRHNSPPHNSHN